ncbi:MAG: ATP-dependent zinc metalloprotease FtsH [Chloroflexi bacterium]|nr:ATP-dependent zinc metalloprotease FtsH [Chloroflexota bacterium]
MSSQQQTTPTSEIAYTTFKDQVRAENVREVTTKGDVVTGVFVHPYSSPDQKGGAVTDFSTRLPSYDDPELAILLNSKGVIVRSETPDDGLVAGILTTILPLLFFVGLIFLMTYQSRRAQQSVFGFGKSKARLVSPDRPKVTFNDVAGVEESKVELGEIVEFLKEPGKFQRLGGTIPRGVLLLGPPGTGKTLLAKAVAGEAKVPFLSITGSEFVEMLVGVGASRVRDLFETAKKSAPSLVFIDEIDAVGRQRGAGLGGGNDEREQTLNQLLSEMDGFDSSLAVVVIAASNRPDVLDPALLRPGRFDRQILVDVPDRAGREAILKIHTRDIPLAMDVDLATMARGTPGFTGADLANLANEAALLAARKDKDNVEMEDFEAARDKVLMGPERSTVIGEEEKKLIAYHEAGHTLVACLLPKADPIHKVTIVPRGRALGVTQQLPLDDRHNYPKQYLIEKIAVALGGRAAEKLVFNDVTSGAESDLKAVTALARRMVGQWGMSDEVGPVSLGLGEEHPFLGREMALERNFSEQTAAIADREIKRLVAEAENRALSLIRQNRTALDRIAAALLQDEVLEAVQIKEILALEGIMLPAQPLTNI